MSLSVYPFPTTGGLDRSVASMRASHDSFYNSHMLRQHRTERGRIEQTPYFSLSKQLSQATISDNAGSSTTESTTSAVLGIAPYGVGTGYVVTQKAVWKGNLDGSMTQLKVYVQTLNTTGSGLTTGCFITIEDEATALTLNSSIEIVIDGATTFKWRVNAGAYTTLVPITITGVSINGGTIKVWFLTTTGFSVNDSWAWTRYDTHAIPANSATSPYPALPTGSRQIDFVSYDKSVYFIAPNSRVFKITIDSSSVRYCITTGYRPIYGHNLAIFAKHLFVAGAVEHITSQNDLFLWTDSVSCSDLNNLDNFIQTDTNEADTYRFSENATADISGNPIVVGFFTTRTAIYIILRNAIRYSSYLGLPTVFNFELFSSFDTFTRTIGDSNYLVVQADTRVYLCGAGGIYSFDGASLTNVGKPIEHILSPIALPSADGMPTANTYLSQYQELYLLIGSTVYCFQETYNVWHTRAASFASVVYCMASDWYGMTVYLGLASRNLYVEDLLFTNGGSSSPVKDTGIGATYSVPTLTTHLLSGGCLSDVKEFQSQTFIGAKFMTAPGTYTLPYIQLNHYNSTDGSMPSVTTDTTATLVSTTSPAFVSAPRISFRAAALELCIYGASNASVAPGKIDIYALETTVKNLDLRKVVK